jgi:hypothetical protein
MAEYEDKLCARRRGNTIAALNAKYEATVNAVSSGGRRENSPHDRGRRSLPRQGRSRKKTPGLYKEDVQKRHRPARSSPAPTGEPFRAAGLSAAAYGSGCAPFLSPPYTDPS